MHNGLQTLTAYFSTNGWRFQVDEARRIVQAMFSGTNGDYHCVAVGDETDDAFQVLTSLPARVPLHRISAAAGLFVRAALGMKLGKFEMDYDDGEAHFAASSASPAVQLADADIQHLDGVNLAMAYAFFLAFMSVLCADVLPSGAVRQVRSGSAKHNAENRPQELQALSRISLN